MAVKFGVAVGVILFKEGDKAAESIDTLGFECIPDLFNDVVWWLAAQTENWVNIGVVTRATEGHLTCKLFKV
jgi:hypothetical protein